MRLARNKAEAREAYARNALAERKKEDAQSKVLPMPGKRARDELGWERSVPRCETCKWLKGPKTILRASTSAPVLVIPPVCRRGNFYTLLTAVCDHWVGSDGSTLENCGIGRER